MQLELFSSRKMIEINGKSLENAGRHCCVRHSARPPEAPSLAASRDAAHTSAACSVLSDFSGRFWPKHPENLLEISLEAGEKGQISMEMRLPSAAERLCSSSSMQNHGMFQSSSMRARKGLGDRLEWPYIGFKPKSYGPPHVCSAA